MPTRSDWAELARQTFHAVDREDVVDLYHVEWRQAADVLMAGERAAIEKEKSRFRRALKKTNAVLFGLTKKLAPARRIVFAVALLFALFGMLVVESGRHADETGVRITLDFHAIAIVLLVFLVGMELVDKLAFRDELTLARELQSALVLKSHPAVPGFEIGAFNRIANMVGGDLYDFEPLPDGRLAVLFGDASGHGMTAGLVMAVTHAGFRTQIEVDPSPEAVVASLNRILCRSEAFRAGGARQFFAGVAMLLEKDGSYRAIVAGHPPVLKVDATGRILERIGTGSYPVGVREGATWTVEKGILAEGETLLFHSDGLPEATDARGAEFGDARVERVVARRAGATAPQLVDALSAELADFLGRKPPDDDVSIAGIRRVVDG